MFTVFAVVHINFDPHDGRMRPSVSYELEYKVEDFNMIFMLL